MGDSAGFHEQLQGKRQCCKITIVIVFLVICGWWSFVAGPLVGIIGFTTCFCLGVAIVFCAWHRVGKPHDVELSLLARFFLQGGFLATACAMVLEGLETPFWQNLEKGCIAGHGNHTTFAMTLPCNLEDAAQYVLSPGLVEESFKALWLLWVLRPNEAALPGKCCFCFPVAGCGCWFKLAPTPYHVILCALALGAGFESVENLLYVASTGLATGVA